MWDPSENTLKYWTACQLVGLCDQHCHKIQSQSVLNFLKYPGPGRHAPDPLALHAWQADCVSYHNAVLAYLR